MAGKGSGGCIIYVRWEGGLIPCEVGVQDTIDDIRRQLPAELQSRPLLNGGESVPDGTQLADAGVGSESVLECPLGGMHWDPDWGGEFKHFLKVEKQTMRFLWSEGGEQIEDATLFARLEPPAHRVTLPRVSATLSAHSTGRFPTNSYRVGFSLDSLSTKPTCALGNTDGGFGLLAGGSTFDSFPSLDKDAEDLVVCFGEGDKVHLWLDAGEGKFFVQVEKGEDKDPPVLACRWVPIDEPLWLTVCAYDVGLSTVVLEGEPPDGELPGR
eukprot:Hpha_TRINITY_DN32055_c0_g1::TRINITY_DN32055_c0_g1_i1::g.115806::m.115806